MRGFPGGSVVKNPPAMQEMQVQSLGWKDSRRRKWQPTPIFLPGKLYEQRSLVGYSSWNCKELDATGQLSTHAFKYMNTHVHSSIIDSSQKAEATKMSNKGYSSHKNKSVQFRSVTQSCLTLCDPMECSMPGFPVTNSQSLLKLMPIKMVMPFNNLILCCPVLLFPSVFPRISVFSNQSVLCIRWPKYWSFSSSISPSNEYLGLISFRMD